MVRLAEDILSQYGEVRTWTLQGSEVTIPVELRAAAEADHEHGGEMIALWAKGVAEGNSSPKLRMNSPLRAVYFAYRHLEQWEKMEALNLGLIDYYATNRSADFPKPWGCYVAVDTARKKIAEQRGACVIPDLVFSQVLPRYVSGDGSSVALRDIACWLSAPLRWDAATKTASLALGDELWQFVPGSARVDSSAGGVFLLPKPVSLEAGRLRVPLEALKIAGTVKWDSTTRIAWFTPRQSQS